MAIRVQLKDTPKVRAVLHTPPMVRAVLAGVVIGVGSAPVYDGAYEITPKTDAQTLYTAHKQMLDDVTVKAIPRHDVTNDRGGVTVSIARILE